MPIGGGLRELAITACHLPAMPEALATLTTLTSLKLDVCQGYAEAAGDGTAGWAGLGRLGPVGWAGSRAPPRARTHGCPACPLPGLPQRACRGWGLCWAACAAWSAWS